MIPKLCKFLYDSLGEQVEFWQLIMMVVRQLEGAYALIFKASRLSAPRLFRLDLN